MKVQFDPVVLLSRMISVPSVSRSEADVADLLEAEMMRLGLSPHRFLNNIWAVYPGYSSARPTLMLNSHIDTVRLEQRSVFCRDNRWEAVWPGVKRRRGFCGLFAWSL